MNLPEAIQKGSTLGATYSREYFMTTGRILATHFFNDEGLEVGVYNHPTQAFVIFNPPKKWVDGALEYLAPRAEVS